MMTTVFVGLLVVRYVLLESGMDPSPVQMFGPAVLGIMVLLAAAGRAAAAGSTIATGRTAAGATEKPAVGRS